MGTHEAALAWASLAQRKINTQKSLAFPHTTNEKTKREIKETIPLTIATKIIKYLGINGINLPT